MGLRWPAFLVLFLAPVCFGIALFAPSELGGLEYWPISAIVFDVAISAPKIQRIDNVKQSNFSSGTYRKQKAPLSP